MATRVTVTIWFIGLLLDGSGGLTVATARAGIRAQASLHADRATITLPENQTQVTTVTASGGTPPCSGVLMAVGEFTS